MTLGKVAVDAIKAWNPLSPEAYARRDRNKAYRKARKKSKRGETLTEQEAEVLRITPAENVQMFPKNTMRSSGISLVAFAPILAMGLRMAGVVDSCTPEDVAMGCITAGDMAATLMGALGAVLYVVGRNRAEKRVE